MLGTTDVYEDERELKLHVPTLVTEGYGYSLTTPNFLLKSYWSSKFISYAKFWLRATSLLTTQSFPRLQRPYQVHHVC